LGKGREASTERLFLIKGRWLSRNVAKKGKGNHSSFWFSWVGKETLRSHPRQPSKKTKEERRENSRIKKVLPSHKKKKKKKKPKKKTPFILKNNNPPTKRRPTAYTLFYQQNKGISDV